MKKVKKVKKSNSKNVILMVVIALFIGAPLLINVGLVLTDILYENTGYTLTASGLNNTDWLDFWKQYLAIAISFLGIYLVYVTACKDREKEINEKNAQQYLEEVRREEDVLVGIVQCFNTGVVFNALLTQENNNVYEGRKVLADSRTEIDQAHIKFEILTDLCDDFEKCDSCQLMSCVDKNIMIELKNLFYAMEEHYMAMLEAGEKFLTRLEQEQGRKNSLEIENKLYINTVSLTNLYKGQGMLAEANASELELKEIKKRMEKLEAAKLETSEMNEFIQPILKDKDYVEKEVRPKFIRYSKAYIDNKKNHVKELRNVGYISYNKVEEKSNG